MKGAVFLGDRRVELREFDEPAPRLGEVIVAIRASGMCGSDLHYYRSAPGELNPSGECIAGHEPAGVVLAVGPGVDPAVASVGDRVMVHHYAGCGHCDQCRTGWPQLCTTAPMTVFGTHDHGAHAPLMRVPASTLVPLNSSLSFKAGAAISCGTGTAWGALDRLGDVGGATIAIFGQGPVGLSGTLLASARGARVIAVDVQPSRLEQARRMGAADTINAADATSVADAIRYLTRGEGVSLALETSGTTPAIADCIASVALWGRACFVGLGGEVCFPVAGNHLRQLTLMTSISMSIVQQRQCAEFVSNNALNVDALFSHEWRLDDVIEAYEWFDRQDAGKGVILLGEQ